MKYTNAYDVLPQEVIDQVRRYTFGLVYFPNKKPETENRDQTIQAKRADGASIGSLSKTYGLSERRVYQILARKEVQ